MLPMISLISCRHRLLRGKVVRLWTSLRRAWSWQIAAIALLFFQCPLLVWNIGWSAIICITLRYQRTCWQLFSSFAVLASLDLCLSASSFCWCSYAACRCRHSDVFMLHVSDIALLGGPASWWPSNAAAAGPASASLQLVFSFTGKNAWGLELLGTAERFHNNLILCASLSKLTVANCCCSCWCWAVLWSRLFRCLSHLYASNWLGVSKISVCCSWAYAIVQHLDYLDCGS